MFKDGEVFRIGELEVEAMHTPGHTPAGLTYVVRDGLDEAAFVGDTLLMPDYGTARCDFPGGDARTLFHSINKVLSLPLHTSLYLCHDYPSAGRETRFLTTVAEQRQTNIHVRDGISEEEFVAMRTQRDAGLEMPALIRPSAPVPEGKGVRRPQTSLNAI